MDNSAPADIASIRGLAAKHGLDIAPDTIAINELGLDFRVAIAEASDGESWVLRIPRRPDVMARAAVEGRLLESIAGHLSVAVPNWRIHSDELIAYPLLPGDPGLTIDAQGRPHWHFDVEAKGYADALGDLLAELHGIDTSVVDSSGIDVHTPGEVRERKRADIAQVEGEFEVAANLRERWRAWLDDDRYWPEWTTFTHGELYPAHQLMVDTEIVAVLDWTTAMVSDPARDFVFHHSSVSPKAFDATVQRYVDRGGRVSPLLAEHCAELLSTSAVEYGLYALQTGDPDHFRAAAAQLNPPREDPDAG